MPLENAAFVTVAPIASRLRFRANRNTKHGRGLSMHEPAMPRPGIHSNPVLPIPEGTQAAVDSRIGDAKRAYITRRFDLGRAACLLNGAGLRPRAGDLTLAAVRRLGHHKKLEGVDGRRQKLYAGDEILVCCGTRYASDQFEAVLPEALGPCELVAAGGIAAQVRSRHGSTRQPTALELIGLVADRAGRRLNLQGFSVPWGAPEPVHRPHVIAVIGTAMNAGKTTTAATLVRGLTRSGHRVGIGKVTGTGAGPDRWAYLDAGAHQVLDFSDFGFASTYLLEASRITSLFGAIHRTLAMVAPDVIILEIADGVLFEETAALVTSKTFGTTVDSLLLAGADALGIVGATNWLRAHGRIPSALAGVFTSSPLAVREVECALGNSIPVLGLKELEKGSWLPFLEPEAQPILQIA